MSESIIQQSFDGFLIQQRAVDGYCYATSMCQATGKLFADYYRLASTTEFLTALSQDMGYPISELVQVTKGGVPSDQGTWIHPRVAIHLGQWCSSEFAVFVSRLVFDWFTNQQTAFFNQRLDGMVGITNQRFDTLESRYGCRFVGLTTLVGKLQEKLADQEATIKELLQARQDTDVRLGDAESSIVELTESIDTTDNDVAALERATEKLDDLIDEVDERYDIQFRNLDQGFDTLAYDFAKCAEFVGFNLKNRAKNETPKAPTKRRKVAKKRATGKQAPIAVVHEDGSASLYDDGYGHAPDFF